MLFQYADETPAGDGSRVKEATMSTLLLSLTDALATLVAALHPLVSEVTQYPIPLPFP